ncbi:hypothetical protein L0337_32835 [candidate division KSB1 bacterium]|nr:hypothetical protein [candidate division KSB1 bacterium]
MKFFKISFIGVAFSLVAISTFAQQSAPSHQAYISVDSQHSALPVLIDGKEIDFTLFSF